MAGDKPVEKPRPRSGAVWIFAAGAVAGGFLFYALAWRTGALVPGHWLTLPSRDAFTSRPTPVRAIPTIPFPTPSPSPVASAASTTPLLGAAPLPVSAGLLGSTSTSGSPLAPASSSGASRPGAALLAPAFPVPPLALLLPVVGAHVRDLHDNFDETRGGTRRHEAIDILAPRGSPVVAAVDGTIAKLFTSQQGGLTVYEFDSTGEYCYYYAHLDRYAPGLAEGMAVTRGTRLGDVGTTGNAPKNTPHLHFAVFRLGPQKRWWEGEAVNPFPMLQKAEER
jgi:murein DD-endopeptidase MepM/ murein hydrolase activator NlpD